MRGRGGSRRLAAMSLRRYEAAALALLVGAVLAAPSATVTSHPGGSKTPAAHVEGKT